jgi:hypothetical protein
MAPAKAVAEKAPAKKTPAKKTTDGKKKKKISKVHSGTACRQCAAHASQ